MIESDPAIIPEELRALPQWVRWGYVQRPGQPKPAKVPFCPTNGACADATKRETWGTFGDALANVGKHGTCGVGFVLTPQDPYIGIDFDNVIRGGVPLPSVALILEDLHSYAERSPSGLGVRVIGRGLMPPEARKAALGDGATVEWWDHSRYVTLTGQLMPGSTEEINDTRDALARIIDRYRQDLSFNPPGTSASQDRPTCTIPEAVRIGHAERYLAKVPGAVSGEFGGTRTFVIAQRIVRGFLLDEEIALAVMMNWNASCVPPWSQADLLRKIREAATKGRLPWGCMYDEKTLAQRQSGTPNIRPAPATQEEDSIDAPIVQLSEFLGETLTDFEWLIGGAIASGSIGMLVADPTIGKTTLLVQIALCLAAGRAPFYNAHVARGVPVLYLAAEGSRAAFQNRVRTAASALGVPNTVNWYIQDRSVTSFDVDSRDFAAMVRRAGARLVICDTIGYFWSGDENSAVEWKAHVMKPLRRLAADGITFILVHHQVKASPDRAGWQKGRGTSAMFADLDFYLRMEPVEGDVSGTRRTLHQDKNKYGEVRRWDLTFDPANARFG